MHTSTYQPDNLIRNYAVDQSTSAQTEQLFRMGCVEETVPVVHLLEVWTTVNKHLGNIDLELDDMDQLVAENGDEISIRMNAKLQCCVRLAAPLRSVFYSRIGAVRAELNDWFNSDEAMIELPRAATKVGIRRRCLSEFVMMSAGEAASQISSAAISMSGRRMVLVINQGSTKDFTTWCVEFWTCDHQWTKKWSTEAKSQVSETSTLQCNISGNGQVIIIAAFDVQILNTAD